MDPLEENKVSHRSPSKLFYYLKKLGRRSLSLILEPFQWLQMLSQRLNPSFIFGVFLVYGLNQGFSISYFKVTSDYYWKDVQKAQPSSVQIFIGLYYIPFVMKPVWGLLTDVFPVMGYRRRPYLLLAGVVGTASALTVALDGKVAAAVALCCLIGVNASVAMGDVIIDACVARNSIEERDLAPDLQSLCWFCASVGALIGYFTSGFFVHYLGAQGSIGLLAIPSASLIGLGFVMYEVRSTDMMNSHKQKSRDRVEGAMRIMVKTMKYPQVWKPALYMYLSFALNLNTDEGLFYWYTNSNAGGPAFSQEFVGMIHSVGALASIFGVVIYHKMLKEVPFRPLIFFAQLLYALIGMLDLVFVLRWNLIFAIPNSFFVIVDECATRIIARVKWMPMIVLSTKICPPGIEGMFFSILACIDGLGLLSSKWGGGVVLHSFRIDRTNFVNLWMAILLRNVMRFVTLAFVFLIPNVNQIDGDLLPSDVPIVVAFEEDDDSDNLQLVPLNDQIEI